MLEVDQEQVYHKGSRDLSQPEIEPDAELFSLGEFGQEETPDEPEIIEHTVELERVKTICYWRPEGIEHSPPIGVANIKQCNRFDERQD